MWGTDVDGGTTLNLTVEKATRQQAAQNCELRKATLPGQNQEDVPRLGRSAIWKWEQVSILVQANLLVCWDDAITIVMLTGERDQASLRTTATAIAQTAHSRL